MNILALDTSGTIAGCAVLKDGTITCSVNLSVGKVHSETILPLIDQAMEISALAPDKIDCVAVAAGPGSFTGVRIGVCLAKGIAHALQRPCAGVDALEALAMNFWGCKELICPILDARRDQVYTALFSCCGDSPLRRAPDEAVSIEQLIDQLPLDEAVVFAGDAVERHRNCLAERLGNRALFAPASLVHLSAEAIALCAAKSPDTWIAPEGLKPIYLRKPQAVRAREASRSVESRS